MKLKIVSGNNREGKLEAETNDAVQPLMQIAAAAQKVMPSQTWRYTISRCSASDFLSTGSSASIGLCSKLA